MGIARKFNKGLIKVKLTDLASSGITVLKLKHPVTDDELPVEIEGYTPDSAEWRVLQKTIVQPNKKQNLIIEKGRNLIELDANSADKRRELLSKVITNITGLDGWVFSTDAVVKLFDDPLYSWMLDQWGEHVDDRANFFGKPVTVAKSGSKT